MWSDPEESLELNSSGWAFNPRGAGWLFGDKVAREFIHQNSLELIVRAHQLVDKGYKYFFKPELDNHNSDYDADEVREQ